MPSWMDWMDWNWRLPRWLVVIRPAPSVRTGGGLNHDIRLAPESRCSGSTPATPRLTRLMWSGCWARARTSPQPWATCSPRTDGIRVAASAGPGLADSPMAACCPSGPAGTVPEASPVAANPSPPCGRPRTSFAVVHQVSHDQGRDARRPTVTGADAPFTVVHRQALGDYRTRNVPSDTTSIAQ